MKIRAAILVEQHAPLIVDDIHWNESLDYGQVLVKIEHSSICGSQLGEMDGVKGPDKYLPHLLGHEGGAVVVDVGPGVTRVNKGDHVVMHWSKASGINAAPPHYQWGDKTVNAGWVTTFNNHAVVSENRITPIPKDTDLKVAALMGCAVLTGFGVINNDASVKIGQSVVIFGVGGVGLNIAQAASLVAAYPIIGIDLFENKLVFSKEFGVTHTVDASNTENMVGDIYDIVGCHGADVVIDTTGNPRAIEQAYAMTHHTGKTILVGVPRANQNISIHSLPLHFGKVFRGSHGGNATPEDDIPRYLRFLKSRDIDLGSLMQQTFSLEEINDAFTLLKSGRVAGRILIDMTEH